ncbi:MAG: FixH family protein [Acetobacteraceae bacterium]|nr:FixH family protein [Acetobacteraceae bacterium]
MVAPVAAPRSAWRLFPYFIVAALGLVVAVNIGMAVLAHRTAPGLAVQGSFATSNAYGHIQQEARRQVSLGWTLDVALHDGHLDVVMAGPDGAPLPGGTLEAFASRPVGHATPLALVMREASPGRFRSDIVVPGRGQWDVLFVARSEGRSFRHARRIIAP